MTCASAAGRPPGKYADGERAFRQLDGAARVTYDVDIVYDRSEENIERIVAALAPLKPYLRGAPGGLPFRLDEQTLQRGLNFAFATAKGGIDLLGELTGVGSFAVVRTHALEAEIAAAGFRSSTSTH